MFAERLWIDGGPAAALLLFRIGRQSKLRLNPTRQAGFGFEPFQKKAFECIAAPEEELQAVEQSLFPAHSGSAVLGLSLSALLLSL